MMGKGYEEKMMERRVDAASKEKTQDPPQLVWEKEGASQQSPDAEFETVAAGSVPNFVRMSASEQDQEMAMTANVDRPLMDPLVNDLDRNSRYYLYHFATQLCEVMVVYDMPGGNPIRDIIPATSAYPLLLQIILANSAFHVFNITQNPMGQSAYQGAQSPTVMAYYQAVSRFGGPLKSSYRDALVAKQQALSLLAKSVVSVNTTNIDLILITILLFVNYALVESGRDKWKVHMDGALKLIKLLGEPPYLQRPMSRLRQTILSDFLVFYILGSTFSFTTLPALIPETIELDPILRYAETNNYLSCPGPLLRIMLESFALPDTHDSRSETSTQEYIQEQVAVLLRRALAFDPIAWSFDFERASPFEDIEQRIRIASAHRSAVCIYLARVLPSTNPLLDPTSGTALVSLTALADDVVHHISHLKPGDALFKSICWPLFLAGAESEDRGQREWIMDTLDQLYGLMFWGYLHTSKRVLESIWKLKDEAGAGAGNCWVEEVKDFGNEILIA
ncbi:acriflavine sensitivity control protein acr-2 [Decorospora gaudefroyi]|uniref:Acriflavine sensitivity control protein acr-2 n=1 Tax=Decorospora gaudefroyi TaxID=184978 RepID=A0A6A5KKE0_9PLEO|nr:acriflavine sensitivity control protein acr-2 [Decorospora gaudefroyi]